jgi:hypothetical protein
VSGQNSQLVGQESGPIAVGDAEQAYRAIIAMLPRKSGGRDSWVHPEVRKVLEQVLDRLVALGGEAADDRVRAVAITRTIRGHDWLSTGRAPSEEQAWALVDALSAVWIRTASRPDLEVELLKFEDPVLQSDIGDQERRAWLLDRYVMHQRDLTRERARGSLRSKYLRNAGLMLAVLVIGTWLVAVALDVGSGDTVITLCALAGAIGGTLSGARALRDAHRIVDTRTFQTWWWVQPLVGAAIGMFIFTLLASSVITLPGSESRDPQAQAAARIVYAFIAGFSEPFLLKVMDGLAGVAQRAAPLPSPPPGERDSGTAPQDGPRRNR